MNFRIVFQTKAEQDLDGIEEYLSQFYPSTVTNFFIKLKEKVLRLKEQPYLYPVYEDDSYFRKMTVGDYLLFYNVNEKLELVTVHRIFHSSRDINRQLPPNPLPPK